MRVDNSPLQISSGPGVRIATNVKARQDLNLDRTFLEDALHLTSGTSTSEIPFSTLRQIRSSSGISYTTWVDLSKKDRELYLKQVEDLFAQQFPGIYRDESVRKMLDMSIRGSELMSPAIIAIDEAEKKIAGAMLPFRQLAARARAEKSIDPRESQTYRLIDAGKFPFKDPDTSTDFENSSIYIPAGICRDDDYAGRGIPEKLYKAGIECLREGVYANKVKYIATSHNLGDPAAVKLHDKVGFAAEFRKDDTFCYSNHNDGKIDKAMRFMAL